MLFGLFAEDREQEISSFGYEQRHENATLFNWRTHVHHPSWQRQITDGVLSEP